MERLEGMVSKKRRRGIMERRRDREADKKGRRGKSKWERKGRRGKKGRRVIK